MLSMWLNFAKICALLEGCHTYSASYQQQATGALGGITHMETSIGHELLVSCTKDSNPVICRLGESLPNLVGSKNNM